MGEATEVTKERIAMLVIIRLITDMVMEEILIKNKDDCRKFLETLVDKKEYNITDEEMEKFAEEIFEGVQDEIATKVMVQKTGNK